jgi:hypothetical protein
METHEENMKVLRDMMCSIRENRSSWQLTSEEREMHKKYLAALEAAAAALAVQIYA